MKVLIHVKTKNSLGKQATLITSQARLMKLSISWFSIREIFLSLKSSLSNILLTSTTDNPRVLFDLANQHQINTAKHETKKADSSNKETESKSPIFDF